MSGINPERRRELLRKSIEGFSELGEGSRLEVLGTRTGDEMTLKVARERIGKGLQQIREVTDEVNASKGS